MQAYDSRHWYNKEELCGYMYHCITHFFQNCKKGPFSQILSHICSCSVNFATIKDPLNQLKLILREHHVQQMTRKDLIQPPSEITSINHSIYLKRITLFINSAWKQGLASLHTHCLYTINYTGHRTTDWSITDKVTQGNSVTRVQSQFFFIHSEHLAQHHSRVSGLLNTQL